MLRSRKAPNTFVILVFRQLVNLIGIESKYRECYLFSPSCLNRYTSVLKIIVFESLHLIDRCLSGRPASGWLTITNVDDLLFRLSNGELRLRFWGRGDLLR